MQVYSLAERCAIAAVPGCAPARLGRTRLLLEQCDQADQWLRADNSEMIIDFPEGSRRPPFGG
jgi:hypothetical protein